MYIELTKATGLVTMEKEEVQKEEKKDETEMTETPAVKCEQNQMMSTGRQRFGDTRTMQIFKLDTPILIEFQK